MEHTFRAFIKQADEPFVGWDFSYITDSGRMRSEPLPWSYGSMANRAIQQASSMLDMGTGGGEFLESLRPFPPSVYATESYFPNVTIAKARLTPLGVKVVQIEEDNRLPFQTGQFDLILNQHESFSAKEVRRILKNDGMFLTQQVGGLDCIGINEMLGVPINHEYADWSLKTALKELKTYNFEVIKACEDYPAQRFYDVGALVYYLKAIPWQVPNFDVEAFLPSLYKIHQKIEQKGYIDFTQHRFMVLAKAK